MADDFTTPGDIPARKPNTFRRRTVQGSPIVASLTKTRPRTGTADELKAAATAAGIDLAAEAKTRGVKASGKLAAELLGPMPADETYNRPSAMSGWIAGEQIGLDRWKSRNIIKGIAADPTLLERLDLTGNPGGTDNTILDSVIGAARNAAHETMASDRGTFFHTVTEWAEAGMNTASMPWCDPRFNLTDKLVESVALGWLRFLDDHGLTVLASEITVVCDAFRAAGSVDRFVSTADPIPFGTGTVEMPAGLAVALDIKTSKYRPGDWGYATQIYAYAASVGYDTVTDTRSAHPFGPVSLDHGIIAHLDMEKLAEGVVVWTLIHVDLAVGYRANLAIAEAIEIDRLNAFTRCDTSTTTAPAAAGVTVDRMAGLEGRYTALADSDRARFVDLGVDMKDADAVEAGLDSVDPMAQRLPEPATVPAAADTPTAPTFTATTDEGGQLTDDQTASVHAHYDGLTHNQRQWIATIATDAQRGGAGIGIKLTPTFRRGHLVTALSKLAGEFVDDTEQAATDATGVLHAALQLVAGDDAWSGATCGTIIATLDVGQSEQLGKVVGLAVAGMLPLYFTDWGRPAFEALPVD